MNYFLSGSLEADCLDFTDMKQAMMKYPLTLILPIITVSNCCIPVIY